MKQVLPSILLVLSLTVSANAGTDKTQALSASVANYGTGFYLAPEGGANLSHDSLNGADSSIPSTGNVGEFAGAKVGYVFNTGQLVRPAIEAEIFYNRFGGDFGGTFPSFSWNDRYTMHSCAFMENGVARLNLGAFQPYAGVGLGIFTAEDSVTETINEAPFSLVRNDYKDDATSWAWQVIAGADYYFTPRFSVFVEYKFLNYMNLVSAYDDSRIGQQLLGMGVRVHF